MKIYTLQVIVKRDDNDADDYWNKVVKDGNGIEDVIEEVSSCLIGEGVKCDIKLVGYQDK